MVSVDSMGEEHQQTYNRVFEYDNDDIKNSFNPTTLGELPADEISSQKQMPLDQQSDEETREYASHVTSVHEN